MFRTVLTFLISLAVAWALTLGAPWPAKADPIFEETPAVDEALRAERDLLDDRTLGEELERLETEREELAVPEEAMRPVALDQAGKAALGFYPDNEELVNPFGRNVSVVSEGLMQWLAPRSGRRWHSGLDIVPRRGRAYGRKIYAPGNGFILRRRDWHPAWGAYLIAAFRRGDKLYLTGFFHLKRRSHHQVQERNLEKGINGYVSQGQFIGRVGRTGAARGAHLHIDVVELKKIMSPEVLPRILWTGRDWSEFVNPAEVFEGLPHAVYKDRERPPSGLVVRAVARRRPPSQPLLSD